MKSPQKVADGRKCEACQKASATVRYDGDDLCRPCAEYSMHRDLEEGDMEPGYGED